MQTIKAAFFRGSCATLFCVLAAFLDLTVAAATSEFETANELYDGGRFSEAELRYERQVKSHQWSANLFYNLANCEYRLGSPGRAILNYERALVLEPAHSEARANLALLRGKTGAKLRAPSWRDDVFASHWLDGWSVVAAISGWLAVFILAAILTARAAKRPRLWLAAMGSLAAFAFSISVLWCGAEERDLAIITAQSTDARLAPTDTAGLAQTLPAGSHVRILGERGEWTYCVLPDAGRGWILRGALELVRLGNS